MKFPTKSLLKLIMIPLITISIANAQSKKYIQELKTDTTNHKISIDIKRDISKLNKLTKKLHSIKDFQKTYFIKAEINKQNFILKYDSLIIKDRLSGAKILVDKKLSNKELNESITGELKLYKKYKGDIEQRLIEEEEKFEKIIKKKRKFNKKLNKITENEELNSYLEGEDFIEHSINYCKRTNIQIPFYITFSKSNIEAKIFDKKSNFDLEKYVKNKNNLEKMLEPYFKSENLEKLLEASSFLDTLEQYIYIAPNVKLKKIEFMKQRYKLSRLIEKQKELQNYDKASKLEKIYGLNELRNDTLNPEGIFTFNNKIIVISSFNSKYNSEFLIKGEGIRKSDKMLIRYADENDNYEKHSKANEHIKGGKIIPYIVNGVIQKYYFKQGMYQIRVSYDIIRNRSFTKNLENTLKPVKIDTNYYGLVYENLMKDRQIRFYRNQEGSFVKINYKDSIIIIEDYDDKWTKNTNEEEHIIDYVHIIKKKKKKERKSTKYYFNVERGIEEKNMPIYKKYQRIFLENYNLANPNFQKTQKK